MTIRSILFGIVALALAATQAATAAPCIGDTLLHAPLVDPNEVSHIVPLGNLEPSARHTIPVRHIYVYPRTKAQVFTPAPMMIVGAIYYLESKEWELHLRPCEGVTLYLNHIRAINPELHNKLYKLQWVDLPSLDANGAKLTLRIRASNIPLGKGFSIGWAENFDVGLVDTRKAYLPFARPERYVPDIAALLAIAPPTGRANPLEVLPLVLPQPLFNRCPIDYFDADIRLQMLALLKDTNGAVPAKGKSCHGHMQDVIGTAQGNWWSELNPVNSFLKDETAVSLANWNVDKNVPLFSFNGKATSVPEGTYSFKVAPISVGPSFVNRRFSDVKDTKVYCYEGLAPLNNGKPLGGVILLQLEASSPFELNRMRVEFLQGTKLCAGIKTHWILSTNAVQLYR